MKKFLVLISTVVILLAACERKRPVEDPIIRIAVETETEDTEDMEGFYIDDIGPHDEWVASSSIKYGYIQGDLRNGGSR